MKTSDDNEIDLLYEFSQYLLKYGNTKETDLVEYGIKISGKTYEESRKTLDDMIVKGWAKQIAHDRLDKDNIYIARGDWPLDLALSVEAAALDVKDREKIVEEAKKIFEEAQVVAERRIRKKFPELYKKHK